MTKIPYGTGLIDVDIKGAELLERSTIKWNKGYKRESKDTSEVLQSAIKNPIGTKQLGEILAAKGDNIVIVVDDHTRNAPTEMMLDALTGEIGQHKDKNVSLLVACGTHPPPSTGDLRRILGKYYKHKQFKIVIHDCDAPDLVYVGTTARGTPVRLNRAYMDADIRILTGDITLHYYAGFGGGRKSILPGIASRETIRKNHALLIDERARTANIADNPVHLDMSEAASFAPPDFVLNIVADASGDVVAAYAGDLRAVFDRGAAVAKELFLYETGLFDVLVVSAGGFPKDRNLYQATKAIQNCYQAVVPGGKLILVAECREGIGDAYFEEWMNEYTSYEATEEAIRTNFVLGGHKAFYIQKVMKRIQLSIVSALEHDMLVRWRIQPYESLSAAVEAEIKDSDKDNDNFKIGIVRNGLDTLLVPRE